MVQSGPGPLSRRGHYGASRESYPRAGQDVTNSTGTAACAAAAGTVVRRGGSVLTGRPGNGLVIAHGSGTYPYYGHLSAFRVPLDARVAAGQRIADMGDTGHVIGPHPHFETHTGRLGSTTNPVPFLAARGVDLGGGWPVINPCATGATVKAIQYLITQRGSVLAADGNHGSVSVRAVEKFRPPRNWRRTAGSGRRPGRAWCTRCGAPARRRMYGPSKWR